MGKAKKKFFSAILRELEEVHQKLLQIKAFLSRVNAMPLEEVMRQTYSDYIDSRAEEYEKLGADKLSAVLKAGIDSLYLIEKIEKDEDKELAWQVHVWWFRKKVLEMTGEEWDKLLDRAYRLNVLSKKQRDELLSLFPPVPPLEKIGLKS